jgi:hypothetical protein
MDYLSLSISRALAKEHPVGDPFGGPAYGDRNMPFFIGPAIGAAAATVGAVGTTVAAGSAAAAAGVAVGAVTATTAAISVVSAIATVVTVVGTVLTVVGAVTGNEKLLKVGGYMALAGGVAGFAASGASALTTAGAEATKSTIATAGKKGLEKGLETGLEKGLKTGAKAAVETGFVPPNSVPVPAATGTQSSSGLLNQVPISGVETGFTPFPPTEAATKAATSAIKQGVEKPAGSTLFDTLGKWATKGATEIKDNKEIAVGLLGVTGNVIEGAAKGAAAQEKLDYERQIEQDRLNRLNSVSTIGGLTGSRSLRPQPKSRLSLGGIR